LEKAFSKSDKVAVLGSEPLRLQMIRAAAFLRKPVYVEKLREHINAKAQVKALIDQSYKVIISGSPSAEIATELGATGITVTLNERSVFLALNSAVRILDLIHEGERQNETIRAILGSVDEGMICTDQEGKLQFMNSTAETMLGSPFPKLYHKKITGLSGEGMKGRHLIVTSQRPILVDRRETGQVYVITRVSRIQQLEQHIRRELLAKGLVARKTFSDIAGNSKAIRQTLNIAQKYARFDSTVLITGESGTGKEHFAQGIHNGSRRKNEAFVAVNCAALQESLLESELFGYVKGAFTGARSEGKTGLFELAHRGTIFLDEISELPLAMQGKLLRVLQEGEIARIGDDKVISIDVRVLCATNRNLEKMVSSGQFREDLYYRLGVLKLRIPPLRERLGDIEILTGTLIAQKNETLGTNCPGASPGLLKLLRKLEWRGNVRELSNVIERMLVVSEGGLLTETDFGLVEGDDPLSTKLKGPFSMEEVEKEAIREALRKSKGNKAQAARILGIGTSTLWRKLRLMD
jgi:transcriptional regulator with PAS, ATPase and Fis domain